MIVYEGNDLNEIYVKLLKDLTFKGSRVEPENYALTTYELQNVLIKLTPSNNSYIISTIGKKPSIKYLLAENIWYASGDNSVEFISKFAKKWEEISDDGISNNSAYGYIIKKKYNFDQIEKIIELLSKDKNSRRACIIINDANENVIETKDEQCTLALQFMIRDNKLTMTTVMRSNDVIYGLPYDIPAFIGIQTYIAYRLNIERGDYVHIVSSMHFYVKDFSKIKAIFERGVDKKHYHIDFVKLYTEVESLYAVAYVSPEFLVEYCLHKAILMEAKEK